MSEKITHRKIKPGKTIIKISKDFYEKREWAENNLVCGLDEVGRGCLAGPLVVAAVILNPNNRLQLLKDSKTLTREELQKVAPRILANSRYAYGIVNHHEIDRFNIWNATLIAMRRALLNLLAVCPKLPSVILIDAMPVSLKNTAYDNIEINYFPKGESLSRSIAAASIIAKVKRDNLMGIYDTILPGYKFGKHKGYGTPEHKNMLEKNGKSILHRQTFLRKFDYLLDKPDHDLGTNISENILGNNILGNNEQQKIFCRDY